MSAGAAQVFISHSNRDRGTCEALRSALLARGFDSLFIDFDPVDSIPPGRDWQRELYLALRRCDVVLAVDTEGWRRSQWCFAEIALARSLGKRVMVLRAGGSIRTFRGAAKLVADIEALPMPADVATAEALFLELKRIGLGRLRRFSWDPDRPPYPGLSPLDEADAGVYFGREPDTRAVLDLIERAAQYREKCIVLLIGPSGSGKSSLLRAGVLPQLRSRSDWEVIGPMRASDPDPLPLDRLAALPDGRRALFALDQIDETLGGSGAATAPMIAGLAAIARSHRGRAMVVGTLRADALALLNERIGSLSLLAESFVVGPLARDAYRDIIVGPAEGAGVLVDPRLVDALLADVAASGRRNGGVMFDEIDAVATDALPMLAVMLRRLWERNRQTHELTREGYTALGGLAGVIAQTADDVISASALDDSTLTALRDAFVGMVNVGRGGRFGRQPLRLNGLTEGVRELLKRFEAAGLLVTSATPGCVELAHEALIRTWPLLAGWVRDARDDLVRLERLRMALDLWRSHPEALLEGVGLVEAEELAARGLPAAHSPEATRLIELSRRRRAEAAAREGQRQQALRVSEALRLAMEARQAIEREPETALRVAWEAVLWDRNELSEAVFRETLERMPAPVKVLGDDDLRAVGYGTDGSWCYATDREADRADTWHRDGSPIADFDVPGQGASAIAVVPGRQALMAGRGGLLMLLDLEGNILSHVALPGWAREPYNEPECRLAISANGVGVFQQGAWAWVFEITPAEGAPKVLRACRWVADEKAGDDECMHARYHRICGIALDGPRGRVLSNSSDGTVRCWSLDGDLLATIEADRGEFADAEFLPDGRVVTGTLRGAGQLWSGDGRLLSTFRPSADRDLFISAIDSEGQHFVTAFNGDDHAFEVWDAAGERQVVLAAHKQHYWCAAFSPDGRLVAGGCADGVVRVWEWREGRLAFELHGHTKTVCSVAFAPRDGASLLSASHDGSVRLWSLGSRILPTVPAHAGALRRMTRVGNRLLTCGSDDDTTLLWGMQVDAKLQGTLISTASGPLARNMVLTEDRRGDVRLWRWSDAQAAASAGCLCTVPLDQRGGRHISKAAISPDSSRFVLAYDQAGPRGAELWSADGERVAALIGPSAARVDAERLRIRGLGFQAQTGTVAVGAENGMVWIWAADGAAIGSFVVDTASPDRLLDLAVDPRGEFILVGVRYQAGLWSWTGDELGTLRTAGYKVQRVEISPDGDRLLTVSDNPSGGPDHAQWWSRRGEWLADLDAPGVSSTSDVHFDGSGRHFVLRTGDDVRIYDWQGKLIGVLAAARGEYVSGFAVSPDGGLVAALFSDEIVRIWGLAERRRTMSIRVASSGPFAFDPRGLWLLVGTPKGDVEQHTLDIADLFPGAAERLDRGFNVDEVRRFAVQEPVRLDPSAYTRR